MLDFASLFGGLAILLIAGDVLVRGAVSLANRFGIPPIVIGLTIVAFGTSAPELVISLRAALAGSGGIAIGNVVGSNIANVLLVLGLPSLLAATHCGGFGAVKSSVFMIGATLIFIAFCMFPPLNWVNGLALLVLLGLFLGESVRATRQARRGVDDGCAPELFEEVDGAPKEVWLAVAFLLAGLVALPTGANLTIDGAVAIARDWGVSETAIALTIIAIGTSLPELATTLMAAIRGQAAVGIGNVIGSNVFNLLAIIGTTTLIVPIEIDNPSIHTDLWIMLATSVLILLFAALKIQIGRGVGATFLVLYGLYTVFVFHNNAI